MSSCYNIKIVLDNCRLIIYDYNEDLAIVKSQIGEIPFTDDTTIVKLKDGSVLITASNKSYVFYTNNIYSKIIDTEEYEETVNSTDELYDLLVQWRNSCVKLPWWAQTGSLFGYHVTENLFFCYEDESNNKLREFFVYDLTNGNLHQLFYLDHLGVDYPFIPNGYSPCLDNQETTSLFEQYVLTDDGTANSTAVCNIIHIEYMTSSYNNSYITCVLSGVMDGNKTFYLFPNNKRTITFTNRVINGVTISGVSTNSTVLVNFQDG